MTGEDRATLLALLAAPGAEAVEARLDGLTPAQCFELGRRAGVLEARMKVCWRCRRGDEVTDLGYHDEASDARLSMCEAYNLHDEGVCAAYEASLRAATSPLK